MELNSEILNKFSEHGLTGLVIGALFIIVFTFIRVLNKKDKAHIEFTKEMIANDREERHTIAERHEKSQERLAKAIDDLADAIKRPPGGG